MAKAASYLMCLIENVRTGASNGISNYEMTLNSRCLDDPDSDIVVLTEYQMIGKWWGPGKVLHGDRIYIVEAIVRAFSKREKRNTRVNHRQNFDEMIREMTKPHGDHTTARDMVLYVRDSK